MNFEGGKKREETEEGKGKDKTSQSKNPSSEKSKARNF